MAENSVFLKDVKWIFFDVGSTLIDESECYKIRFHEVTENTDISAEEFEAKAIEFASRNKSGDHEAAKFFGLTLPKWHKEAERLYPDAENTLKILSENGYKLGIIANQSFGTAERLQNWGIRKYIDLVIASAEEGVSKPDPKIFKLALEKADCKPENAVMVGDRIDNDIESANKIGMKTIWIKQGFGKYMKPRREFEKADIEFENIKAIPQISG